MGFLRWLLGLLDPLPPGQHTLTIEAHHGPRWMTFAGMPTRVGDGRFWVAFDDRRQAAFVQYLASGHLLREKRYDGPRAAALQRAIAELIRDGGYIDSLAVGSEAA